jgi:hypothetical protein
MEKKLRDAGAPFWFWAFLHQNLRAINIVAQRFVKANCSARRDNKAEGRKKVKGFLEIFHARRSDRRHSAKGVFL